MRGGVRLGGSDPAEDFDEAVVDVEAVLATDKGLAFLFDSDAGFLLVTDHKGMDLQDRLVHQAQRFLDGLFVDFNDQAAQELVEVIFQTVFFGVSDLDSELHRYLAFANSCHITDAWTVPVRGQ